MRNALPPASFVAVHLLPHARRQLEAALRSGALPSLPRRCQIRKSWLRDAGGTIRYCLAIETESDPAAAAAAAADLRAAVAALNRALGLIILDHPIVWFSESGSPAP